MSNHQRIERALRGLAQPSDRFWLKEYKGTGRVVYRGVRIDDSISVTRLDGDCGVVIYEDASHTVGLGMDFPYDGGPIIKTLYQKDGFGSDRQEVARYTGKLKPVVVTGDLPEDDLAIVEKFASEVKQKWKG